jgi:hypothetical protein
MFATDALNEREEMESLSINQLVRLGCVITPKNTIAANL